MADSVYSLLGSSQSIIGKYIFDNYTPQLMLSDELQEAQANYESTLAQIQGIDDEIEYINSLPEHRYYYVNCNNERHHHSNNNISYNEYYGYSNSSRHGCYQLYSGPVMTAQQKAQKTKQLEYQKMEIQHELNQVSRELVNAQRQSYRNSYLEQMGIKTSSTVSLNSSLVSNLEGSSSEAVSNLINSSDYANSSSSDTSESLNSVLSNYEPWYYKMAVNGEFGERPKIKSLRVNTNAS